MRAPIDSASDLLDWTVRRPVQEFFDVAGRPLGEARAEAIKDVATEKQDCPYAGVRHRHAKPMNVTALRQLPAWQSLLTMLSWLASRFRAESRIGVTTYNDLARVTSSGIFLADYLTLRAADPVTSGAVPTLISGLYKICLGFQLAYMIERYSDDHAQSRLPDPAGFLDYLEATDLLIGDAEVCAGTPAMIAQAYAAVTKSGSPDPDDPPAICRDMAIDWERFDSFAVNAAMLWNELVLFSLGAPCLFPVLADPGLPTGLPADLGRRLAARGDEIMARQTGPVADMAKAVRLWSGLPSSHWEPELAATGDTRGGAGLATMVTDWLRNTGAPGMEDHGADVEISLRPRLARYDAYEAATLASLNDRINGMMRALGWPEATRPLAAADLSRVLGRTLRDWNAAPL